MESGFESDRFPFGAARNKKFAENSCATTLQRKYHENNRLKFEQLYQDIVKTGYGASAIKLSNIHCDVFGVPLFLCQITEAIQAINSINISLYK